MIIYCLFLIMLWNKLSNIFGTTNHNLCCYCWTTNWSTTLFHSCNWFLDELKRLATASTVNSKYMIYIRSYNLYIYIYIYIQFSWNFSRVSFVFFRYQVIDSIICQPVTSITIFVPLFGLQKNSRIFQYLNSIFYRTL